MHRRMCVHARYIPGRSNSWKVPGSSLRVTFCRWKKPPKCIFFFCRLLKETWICFNRNTVWHLLHRRPVLCLNISTPLTFCAFSKLSPQNQASSKIVNPLFPPPPTSGAFLKIDPPKPSPLENFPPPPPPPKPPPTRAVINVWRD